MRERRVAVIACLLLSCVILRCKPPARVRDLFNGILSSTARPARSSIHLLRGGFGDDSAAPRREMSRFTDERRKMTRERGLMDPPLRDALGDAPQYRFWESAFHGIHAAHKDPNGRLRTRRYPTGAVRGGRAENSRKSKAAGKGGARAAGAGIRKKAAPAAASRPRAVRRDGGSRFTPRAEPPSGRTAAPPDYDGARRARSVSGRSSGGAGLNYGSLYSPQERKTEKSAASKPPDFKPPKLVDWLGGDTLKPPVGKLKAPSFSGLKRKFPARLPDGKPYARGTPDPRHIELLAPPAEHPKFERWLELDARRGRPPTAHGGGTPSHNSSVGRKEEPHWHIDGANVPYYHMGDAWGRADDGRWSWMLRGGTRWWTVAAGAQRMVRHAGHWWWKTRDGWFLLHAGEPWVYRHFADWRRKGFLHPQSGTRIVYSADGRRVAVVAPDGGARVFDARSGALLISL